VSQLSHLSQAGAASPARRLAEMEASLAEVQRAAMEARVARQVCVWGGGGAGAWRRLPGACRHRCLGSDHLPSPRWSCLAGAQASRSHVAPLFAPAAERSRPGAAPAACPRRWRRRSGCWC
jgi:hypothetical protein